VDPQSVIDDLNDAANESDDSQPNVDDGESAPEVKSQPKPVPDAPVLGSGPVIVSAGESKHVFGDYKIHIGVSKPKFDKSDEYELVYGDSRVYPTLSVEYFFFDWYATLGLIFRFGYYKDDGYAVIQSGSGYVPDKQGKTELTLVPLQAGIAAQMTPFPAKWVSIGGWFAAEATYFQEIRKNAKKSDTSTSGSGGGSTSGGTAGATASGSNNNKVLTNVGWRYATNIGVSVSFSLNGLDQASVLSMRSMGIGAIYLTPYAEATTGTMSDSDLKFDRVAVGAAFTFETL
jgi:hypothetical protein